MQDTNSEGSAFPNKASIADCTIDVFRGWDAVGQLDTELAASWRQVAADNLSKFRLWASNLGAYHELSDKRSADYRVRAVPEVQDRIIRLVSDLAKDLHEIYLILSGARQDAANNEDVEEGTGISVETGSEVEELWLMVGDVVDSLMRVSVLIRRSTDDNRSRFIRAAMRCQGSEASALETSFDIAHVRQKYPKLERNAWLIERLGRTNFQRRKFLLYVQDHQRRIAYDKSGKFGSRSVFSRPTHADTEATTLVPKAYETTVTDQLDAHDLGDLDATASITTVGSQYDSDQLDVVPLTSVCEDGKPGICPYCHGMVCFSRRKTWRRHVFQDLMAYSCTFEHCEHSPFGSRSAWISHENTEHRRDWRCPSCYDGFADGHAVARHMRFEHPGIEDALIHALIHALVNAASPQYESMSVLDCLFCNDSRTWSRMLRPDSAAPQDGQILDHAFVPLSVYQRHLSHHMEQLALFAVPSMVGDEAEDEANAELGRNEIEDTEVSSSVPSSSLPSHSKSATGNEELRDQAKAGQLRSPSQEEDIVTRAMHAHEVPEEAQRGTKAHEIEQKARSSDQIVEGSSQDAGISQSQLQQKQEQEKRQLLSCIPSAAGAR